VKLEGHDVEGTNTLGLIVTGSRRIGPRCRVSPGLSSLYLGCTLMLFGPAGLAGKAVGVII